MPEQSPLPTRAISLDASGVDVSAFLAPTDLDIVGDLAGRLETRLRKVLKDVRERAVSIAESDRLSASGKAADRRALFDRARARIREALAVALAELAKRRKAAEREIPSDPGALRPDTKPEVLAWRELRAREIREHVASLDVLARQVEAEEVIREGKESAALEWLRALVGAPVPVEGVDVEALQKVFTRRMFAEAWAALESLDRVADVFRREAAAVGELVASHCGFGARPLADRDGAGDPERPA